jgi:hypothetical protein
MLQQVLSKRNVCLIELSTTAAQHILNFDQYSINYGINEGRNIRLRASRSLLRQTFKKIEIAHSKM